MLSKDISAYICKSNWDMLNLYNFDKTFLLSFSLFSNIFRYGFTNEDHYSSVIEPSLAKKLSLTFFKVL